MMPPFYRDENGCVGVVKLADTIIMLTAYPKSGIEEECFSAGANKILNKPVTSEDFKKILKQYRYLLFER